MIDTSSDHDFQRLNALVIRGPALAPAEVSFLKASGSSNEVVTVGEAGVEFGSTGRRLKDLGILRSEFAFWRLNREAIEKIVDCDFIWLPDPWITLSRQGAALANKLGKPYVVTVWENISGHVTTRFPLRRGAARVLENANLVHCVSIGSQQYVAEIARNVTTVQIYPGVDIMQFAPIAVAACGRQPFTFLFVARLVEEKGVRDLLAAFREARKSLGDTIRLVIVGDGPLRDVVTDAACGATGISYVGPVAHDQLASIMAACHTLVLPSKPRKVGSLTVWREQFGFVLAEAMACGLSIIGSDCGAIPEVVGDAGVIVNVGEDLPGQLKTAMVRAARNAGSWIRDSDRARKRAVDCFDGRVNSAELWAEIRKVV